MALRNSTTDWGLVSRTLHWLMALGVLGMLCFGLYIGHFMRFTADNLWVYQIHKSIGVTLLVLVLVRIIWHLTSPPPAALPAPAWQMLAARLSHLALYALLLAVPVSGWIASSASGFDTVIWGVLVPPITPISRELELWMFAAHGLLTKALIGLLIVHVGGAITHAGALRRMIAGRATN